MEQISAIINAWVPPKLIVIVKNYGVNFSSLSDFYSYLLEANSMVAQWTCAGNRLKYWFPDDIFLYFGKTRLSSVSV